MLGGVFHGGGDAEHLVGVLPGRCRDVDDRHASGGHGARLVERDGVDPAGRLEHLGAGDENAELGAAAGADHEGGRGGESERAGAGDDEHRHGGRERGLRGAAEHEPRDEGDDRDPDHDRHEHRRHPVGQALHIRFARLRVLDEARHLGQLRVRPHARRLHHQAPTRVEGRADDRVAGGDVDRHRLSGDEGGVDAAGARGHDPVRRHLLTGTHDEFVADPKGRDRHAHLDAVAQHSGVLGAELQEGSQGFAGPPLGTDFGEAAREEEHRHARCDLEVDRRSARRAEPDEAVRHADHARVGEQQRVQRPQCRGCHPERDQGVHGRRAVPQIDHCGAVERPCRPRHHGERKSERGPLPSRKLPCRHHRQRDDGHGQGDRDEEPRAQRARIRVIGGSLGRRHRCVVAGALHFGDERFGRETGCRLDVRAFGGVVDRRRDAVQAVEALLDAGGARRARHALDVEVDARGRGLGGRRGHQARTAE